MLRYRIRNAKLGSNNKIGNHNIPGAKIPNYVNKVPKIDSQLNNNKTSIEKKIYQSSTGNNASNVISTYRYHSQNPLATHRKTLNCNNINTYCWLTNIVYKDNYSKSSCKLNKCNGRALQPLIKSGMQLNKNKYSTSFYEHNRNYLKNTYDKKLPTKDANISPISYSKGGNCNVCINSRKVHTKYSNKQFYKNSAVSSSTRLEKLKLDAMIASSRCNGNSKCNGKIINNNNNNNMNKKYNNNCRDNAIACRSRVMSYGGINNNSTPINKY